MDKSWINSRPFGKAHLDGVSEFMKLVSEKFDEDAQILCPCRRCLNRVRCHKGQVEDHLLLHGMASTYTNWIYHGEGSEPEINEVAANEDEEIGFNEDVGLNQGGEEDPDDDRLPDMVHELFNAEDEGPAKKAMFVVLLEEMKKELGPGSPYTRFAFVVRLLHIKSFYRINNVAFKAIVTLLSSAFPECSIPSSYQEAKKLIRALGLGYVSIHVCPNNCVLFRKDYEKYDNCPVCHASRWKDTNGKTKVPQKVLRHFPILPRLKRIFCSKTLSELARWHKMKRKPVENELTHPADGEAWKDFDNKYGWFAKDARNIRLGLATDGFNPFGKMSASYSMWPVFLISYNFPPWECMEQSNFMMGLLIPGKESPGKDIDVFLEPLVEELLELWKGVRTMDALTGKSFDLHAAVIWCIHDYPALSTLSGRVTKGYYACVYCDKNPCSTKIRNKICYIGHRRWFQIDHPWRKSREFNGKIEACDKPQEFSAEELMEQLEWVKDVRPGKHPESKKRKRGAIDGQCWKRRSCLWDLPCWSSLKLRHNLDVMHIEKNICEYILGTFLGIVGKTKDTIASRLDLEDMGIRKKLHLKREGDSYSVPNAPYVMDKTQKIAFCEFLRSVKFLDGYASNLATCISADGCNLQGLKTHDCHILLQRIIPAAVRGIMQKDMYEALAELGIFFQQLCAKTLKLDVLHRMKKDIPIILCKLEKIFPPSFFDVMLHLAIHLPDEAILRGPVQYGWMYSVERRLLTLKRFVRNMARPEGSIAEAYVANECLNACSRYFDDIDTRHNRDGRNRERADSLEGDLSVFQHGVDLIGGYTITYLEKDYDKMVWYVLNNCEEAEPYMDAYQHVSYLLVQVARRKFIIREEVNDGLYALASQPDLRVKVFSACLVGGIRFHTVDREKNRRTQNSEVMTEGTHNEEYVDFYGSVKDIIQLRYNSDSSCERTVVLFRCDWYDTDDGKKTRMKYDGYMRSINQGRCWFKNDPFILATQATKVFYLDDTKHEGSWKVVQKFQHRHLWSVAEHERDTDIQLSYQDDECVGSEVQLSEQNLDFDLDSGVSPLTVEATIVDQLRRQRDMEEELEENDSSDSEDETEWQYASDCDEGSAIRENQDNEEDSDGD
ncbi:hypothetical protein U9M48_031052 [Paspalum notatum var. saurae]|uniref:Transposase n=1 Tax=Paspalum notatum var. saurae TaxID=547442 RepID=A0AAQ3X3Z3_PASNO